VHYQIYLFAYNCDFTCHEDIAFDNADFFQHFVTLGTALCVADHSSTWTNFPVGLCR